MKNSIDIEKITSRIDKTTHITEEYLHPVIPAPTSVKIELTGRCNMSCAFCAHSFKLKEQRDMDWDFYTRICKEMLDAGVEELGLFYIGESLLHPRLADAIAYAKSIGFPYVFLTTNGTMLTPEKSDELMSFGLDSLKISYNNSDAFQFRAVTGISARFYEAIKYNIKEAFRIRNDKGYKTKIYASSIMYDGVQQEKMETAVAEILPFVDEHYWLPLFNFGGQTEDKEKEKGMVPTVGNPGRLGCMRPPLPCWAVFKEGHISWDGKLAACCFASDDVKWIMADLNKVSFMSGWNSLAFQELRKAHLDKDIKGTDCENCIVKR